MTAWWRRLHDWADDVAELADPITNGIGSAVFLSAVNDHATTSGRT
jgi:hypothetical protein